MAFEEHQVQILNTTTEASTDGNHARPWGSTGDGDMETTDHRDSGARDYGTPQGTMGTTEYHRRPQKSTGTTGTTGRPHVHVKRIK